MELKKDAISPQNAASMQSRMVWRINVLLCCARVDGAKINMLRQNSSNHQKGTVSLTESQVVVATTMAWMMEAWGLQNAERF